MSGLDPNGGGPLVSPGGGSVTAADITDSTSVGRSVLTATDAAAARAAIGVTGGAGTLIAPTFETGQGWTLVDPSAPGEGAGSFEVVSGAKVGRLTLTSTGWLHGLTGPRIEREFPSGASFIASVRLRSFTSPVYPVLYVRNGSTARCVFALPDARIAGMVPLWAISGPSASNIAFDGTIRLALRRSGSGLVVYGTIDGTGLWTTYGSLSPLTVTHIGIAACADGPWAGTADLDDFTLETFG